MITFLLRWAADGCNSLLALNDAVNSLPIIGDGGDEDEA